MPNTDMVRETLSKWSLSESLDIAKFRFASAFVNKIVGPMYYSWDPRVLFLPKITLKLGHTAVFTHLKIILLQYF